jgi:para-nitrobenzyl esterase
MARNSFIRLFTSITVIFCTVTPLLAQISTAKVTGGVVEGVVKDGIASFQGIPFAAPPVGDRRWRPPVPVVSWQGVRRADKFAPGCVQEASWASVVGKSEVPFSEDCLYLNVWSPARSPKERLPVMVWIYGGGFVSGFTSLPLYDGENLARKGVIAVSIAYRVGPLGFLAHRELSSESGGHGSGNYGLLDQIAALGWVNRNIAAFGGDPNRVTIFGESAGGISVSMLAAAPLAKGLFQGVICESGGSFAPARVDDEGGENVLQLAAAENRGAETLKSLGVQTIAEARKVPAQAVSAAGGGILDRFWPVLDGYVIVDDQYKLYRAGKYNDTPVLVGSNSDEGFVWAAQLRRNTPRSSTRDSALLPERSLTSTRLRRNRPCVRTRTYFVKPALRGRPGPGRTFNPKPERAKCSSTTSIIGRPIQRLRNSRLSEHRTVMNSVMCLAGRNRGSCLGRPPTESCRMRSFPIG